MEVLPEQIFYFYNVNQPQKGRYYHAVIVPYENRNWKLAKYYREDGDLVFEMFNLSNDPLESRNIYNSHEHYFIQGNLLKILYRFVQTR